MAKFLLMNEYVNGDYKFNLEADIHYADEEDMTEDNITDLINSYNFSEVLFYEPEIKTFIDNKKSVFKAINLRVLKETIKEELIERPNYKIDDRDYREVTIEELEGLLKAKSIDKNFFLTNSEFIQA